MKALVVGYGSIGKRHERVLRGLGLTSVDLVTRQSLSHTKTFRSLAEVDALGSYDYFVIASETRLHYEQLTFLDERVQNKLILVEKAVFDKDYPLVPMRNLVYVGYNMRFEAPLQYLKEKLASTPVLFAQAYVGQYLPFWHPSLDYRHSYSASRAKGGGVALDLSHELDYIQWLFGELQDPARIKVRVSGLEIDTDDLFTLQGQTVSGTVISCTMDYLNKLTQRTLLIHTEEETLFVDFIGQTVKIADKTSSVSLLALQDTSSDEPYRKMHEAIIHASGAGVCTLLEAARTLKICL